MRPAVKASLTMIHGLLLLSALLLLLGGLFNAVMAPGWIRWQFRLMIAGMEGERSYRYVLVPVAVALVAWLLRRSQPRMACVTVILALPAAILMAKPALQAWWLGRSLPAQLAAAFGPAAPDRAPFSFAALYAPRPADAPSQEMSVNAGLRLTFFPAVGRSPAPCVIMLHGGGWFSGGHRDQRPFNHWLVRHGYALATLGYRLLPQHGWPAQRDDVVATLAFLRANAAELGVDPDRFVLLGRSAGGQIATATGFGIRDPGIRGVIALYGPADLRMLWNLAADSPDRLNGWTPRELLGRFLGGPPDTFGAAYDSASALPLAGTSSPPTLLLHGRLDTSLPIGQSELLAAKLTAAGRPNLLVELPWATHAYDTIDFNSPGAQLTTYSVAWFLESVTRPGPVSAIK